jgi:hypothetical protein
MYAPPHRPGLEIELLKEEELVLVTTDLATYRANDPRYVHVEWGTDFSLHHAVSFPNTTPSLVANLGPLALNYILLEGGSMALVCTIVAALEMDIVTVIHDAHRVCIILPVENEVASCARQNHQENFLANCLARASAVASAI